VATPRPQRSNWIAANGWWAAHRANIEAACSRIPSSRTAEQITFTVPLHLSHARWLDRRHGLTFA